MVDLDTTGEGQEVELQGEESTKEEKVEEEKGQDHEHRVDRRSR